MRQIRINILYGLLVIAAATAGCAGQRPSKLKYRIDGKVDDWNGIDPVWRDAGRTKPIFPQEFDVKEVYIDNDRRYLYAFLRVKPDLPERFGRNDGTGSIGHFYFDTDNDPSTGSKEVRSIAPYFREIDAQRDVKPEYFVGYEFELAIDIGFTVTLRDPKPKLVNWLSYQLSALGAAGRFGRAVPGGEARTDQDAGLIAYSEDGLEFALPLKCLPVGAGQRLRIMFVEDGGFGKKESYSWTTYRLKASREK